MILDYDRAFREQYQFLPPADALTSADARWLGMLRQWGEQIHNELYAEIQALEKDRDDAVYDTECAKSALEELKRDFSRELDADIPNLSAIRKLCED